MAKTIDKFEMPHVWNAISVFAVCMAIDFAWYGLITKPSPYGQDIVGKLIWTAVLSIAFTSIYNHAATWRPKVDSNTPGKMSDRIINSLCFSLVFYALILSAIALSCYIVSVTFIYILDGFRGSPENMTDNTVLAAKVIGAGLVLEMQGRDETKEGRTG